jgi:hypothetical protein
MEHSGKTMSALINEPIITESYSLLFQKGTGDGRSIKLGYDLGDCSSLFPRTSVALLAFWHSLCNNRFITNSAAALKLAQRENQRRYT